MRYLKQYKLIVMVMSLAAGGVLAAGAIPAEFVRANEAYARGDYHQSIALYEALVAQDAPAPLYYNLGNAYFKSGRIGKAVLNYERARRLAPRDADVRHNLRHLRGLVKEPAPSLLAAVVAGVSGWATINELAAAGAVLLIATAGLLIFFLLRGGMPWLAGAAGALGLLIACVALLGIVAFADGGSRRAVITGGTIEARNGPGADNSIAFTIPEGRIVLMLGEADGWQAIALPRDGMTGWIPAETVERL